MSEPKGFLFPRTASGRSSLVPAPPWHYSGDLLTVEYRTDPSAIARLLPSPLTLVHDDEDPGAVALIFADWQSCADGGAEFLDPVRGQYKEVFFVVRCRYRDQIYSRCVYIWVDKDFALARGYFQGYPKKLGSIHQTRPVTVGRAGPRIAPGGLFAGTLAAADRRLLDVRVSLTGESATSGFVNGHPMLHHRLMPRIEADGTDSLDELVTMQGSDPELTTPWTGSAEVSFYDSPYEEFTDLSVREVLAGYYRSVGVTFTGGTTLAR